MLRRIAAPQARRCFVVIFYLTSTCLSWGVSFFGSAQEFDEVQAGVTFLKGPISVHSGGLRDSDLTKLLGWPGYRVYRHEINERANALNLWIRRKRGKM
jgi:hypothetical protein